MAFRFSCPHTSPQNGKAERTIRTINNIIRTLLTHASLPPHFWHHALQMATYILNILPHKTKNYATPTLLLYNKIPTYDHLRVFGCLCYPLLPSNTIHKLANRSLPCVFLGFPSNHRGYKCYDITSKKIIINRHVVFDENTFPFSTTLTSSPSQANPSPTTSIHPTLWDHFYPQPTPTHATRDNSLTPNHNPPLTPSPPRQTSPITPQTLDPQPSQRPKSPLQTYQRRPKTPIIPPSDNTSPAVPQPPPRTITTRSMSGISKPKLPFSLHTSQSPSIIPIPRNPIDALSIPEWNHAMNDEFRALIENRTWELVPRQHDMNIIRCMWIFKHKTKSDGSLERYKARLVCDGRSQQVGVDCDETFSPVVKPATIRTVLSIALHHDWEMTQLDVKNAFLHGHLSETVYMHQPLGFRHPHFPNHVCKLNKSLYGLKQAPRAWYQRFTDYVTTLGFRQSSCDHSLFVYRQGHDTAYLLLYVDDIILTSSSTVLKRHLLDRLSSEFAMKDLGPLHYFLGLSVKRDPHGLFLSQEKYAVDILARAKMTDCNPTQTPIDTAGKLSASTGELLDDPTTFRSLAGALQYLTFTRPDISYAVQQICMHMHAPRTAHLHALKRILRYINGTLNMGLHMKKSTLSTLISYTDADWAGCPDTRRSTSGYCIYLGDNLLSWSAKRQPTVSRSSAEAEYRGVANVVAEICWIRNLLLELGHPPRKASIVYCDNVSAVYLSNNPVQHQRTKHIEIDIHFVREKVQRGQIRVLHVPSRYQIADIFTKGLPRHLFTDFRSNLSIREPPP